MAAKSWTCLACRATLGVRLPGAPGHGDSLELRAAEWAELRDAFPVPAGVQIGMFDDPIQGTYALCRRAIRDELAARSAGPDEPVTIRDRMALSQLQDLIDAANRARAIPPFGWGRS